MMKVTAHTIILKNTLVIVNCQVYETETLIISKWARSKSHFWKKNYKWFFFLQHLGLDMKSYLISLL